VNEAAGRVIADWDCSGVTADRRSASSVSSGELQGGASADGPAVPTKTVGGAILQYAARASLSATGSLAVIAYVVLRIAAGSFYAGFGVSPEEVGLGQAELLARSAGIAAIAALFMVMVGVVLALADEFWRDIQRRWRGQAAGGARQSSASQSTTAREGITDQDGPGRCLSVVPSVLIVGGIICLLFFSSTAAGQVAVIVGVWVLLFAVLIRGVLHLWQAPIRGRSVLVGFAAPFAVSMGLVIALLFVAASNDRGIAFAGRGISDWGVPWDATVVTVEWIGPGPPPVTVARLACGIYLGSGGGKAVVVNPINRETLRIPDDRVILRSYASSGAKQPICTGIGVRHNEAGRESLAP
jgi:hypothetical protein